MPFSIETPDGVTRIRLHVGGEGDVTLPPMWLRERSTHPTQLDTTSGQRLFDPHLLGADLGVADAVIDNAGDLIVRFSDGHCDRFNEAALAEFIDLPDGLPRPAPWSAATTANLPAHRWTDVANDDTAMFKALADFLRIGAIVITGAPTTEGTVATVAEHFGFVRETNFGRIFDVRSVPNPNDLAYTSGALGPHTDNPYRNPVPGIQLLHCLVNETDGGDSTLVDSLAVVERLRSENPEWFDVLATTPVQFRFRDATTDLRSMRTVIERDAAGLVTGLNFSPRLDHLPLLTIEQTHVYQSARHRLAELLRDPSFELRLRLQPGDVEMFANDRVLHGRSAYDPNQGKRHLQGCYIDADGPRSRYRVLAPDVRRPERS